MRVEGLRRQAADEVGSSKIASWASSLPAAQSPIPGRWQQNCRFGGGGDGNSIAISAMETFVGLDSKSSDSVTRLERDKTSGPAGLISVQLWIGLGLAAAEASAATLQAGFTRG